MTYAFDIQTETATITVGENSIVVPLENLSDLVGIVFSARKSGYEAKREVRKSEQAARKAKAEAKKSERQKSAAKRKADRISKLEKQLAELKK